MDLQSLAVVLRAALSHVPEERKAAEESLNQVSPLPPPSPRPLPNQRARPELANSPHPFDGAAAAAVLFDRRWRRAPSDLGLVQGLVIRSNLARGL
jgi:hypothetical protein